jgi:hypothetical protein
MWIKNNIAALNVLRKARIQEPAASGHRLRAVSDKTAVTAAEWIGGNG